MAGPGEGVGGLGDIPAEEGVKDAGFGGARFAWFYEEGMLGEGIDRFESDYGGFGGEVDGGVGVCFGELGAEFVDGAEEFLLGFSSDAPEFIELAWAGELEQIVDRVESDAFEEVNQAGTEAEDEEGGIECGGGEHLVADGMGSGLEFGMGGCGGIDGFEDGGPSVEHFLGVIEALLIIAVECFAEEVGELVADIGVTDFDVEGDLFVGEAGLAAFPAGAFGGGHFVESHGHGVEFGAEVVAFGLSIFEEGIDVVQGSGAEFGGVGAGEGEVEEAEALMDADIFGFDVAVEDALLVEVMDGSQEFFAMALEHFENQWAIVFEQTGKGLFASEFYGEGGEAVDVVALECFDDIGEAEFFEDGKLFIESAVGVWVFGDFEDAAGIAFGDEQGFCAGSPAEDPLDDESVAELVAVVGIARVGDLVFWAGEFVEDIVELGEEIINGPARHDAGAGAFADEFGDGF